jgi:hypothetical protein
VKTVYKFIRFIESHEYLNIWVCHNNHTCDVLGQVQWYSPWRQYVFLSSAGPIFSVECLEDINQFIRELTAETKREVINE